MLGTWVFISYCLEIKENIDLWPVQCIEVPNFRWQSILSWERCDFWALLINPIIQHDWIMWPSWECYWVLVKWPLQLGWCLYDCSDFRKDRSWSHWQFLAFFFFLFFRQEGSVDGGAEKRDRKHWPLMCWIKWPDFFLKWSVSRTSQPSSPTLPLTYLQPVLINYEKSICFHWTQLFPPKVCPVFSMDRIRMLFSMLGIN